MDVSPETAHEKSPRRPEKTKGNKEAGSLSKIGGHIKVAAMKVVDEAKNTVEISSLLTGAQKEGIRKNILKAGKLQKTDMMYHHQRRAARQYINELLDKISDDQRQYPDYSSTLEELLNAVRDGRSGSYSTKIKVKGRMALFQIRFTPQSHNNAFNTVDVSLNRFVPGITNPPVILN